MQKSSKAPKLRRLEQLIIFSFADNLDFTTKIRLLSKGTRELTENSFIVREGRTIVLKSEECWLCKYQPVHLRAVTSVAENLVIYVDEFVKKSCERRHSPYKQFRSLLESLGQRFCHRKVTCMFNCEPSQPFCSRMGIYAEICAIQTGFEYKEQRHFDFDGLEWGYLLYETPEVRKC